MIIALYIMELYLYCAVDEYYKLRRISMQTARKPAPRLRHSTNGCDRDTIMLYRKRSDFSSITVMKHHKSIEPTPVKGAFT